MSLALKALAGALLGLVLVVGAGPAFRNGFPLLVAFGSLALGAVLGLAGGLTGLTAVLLGMKRGQPLSVVAITGMILGLVAFAVPFQRVWAARSLPAIHDISTDLSNPPTFQAVMPLRQGADNDVTFSEETAAEQRRAYPDIRSLMVPKPPGDVFDEAIDAARAMDWEIVAADRTAGRLEATDTTRWFGFKDDVVVRLMPDGTGTRVDVRSVSRIGRGDLGTNANRIRTFLNRLRNG